MNANSHCSRCLSLSLSVIYMHEFAQLRGGVFPGEGGGLRGGGRGRGQIFERTMSTSTRTLIRGYLIEVNTRGARLIASDTLVFPSPYPTSMSGEGVCVSKQTIIQNPVELLKLFGLGRRGGVLHVPMLQY